MNMTHSTSAACCLAAAACFASAAHAQTTPPLTAFVNDPATNASELHQETGVAVQRMCGVLGAQGGLRLTGAQGDLFQRCNELVETARTLLGGTSLNGRTLGYTDRNQLLAALQQVTGEEIAAQGALVTQSSSGQFANIGGRLNALRLGGARAAARGGVAQLDSSSLERFASLDTFAQPLGGGASADEQDVRRVDSPVGWFVETSYGFGDHDQTVNEDAFDFDTLSATTGTDYNFGSGAVGLAIGFDRYVADFDSAVVVSGGEVEVEGLSGSLFAGFFGEGWTLNAIATYGRIESEVVRRAIYSSANAACNPACGASRTLRGDPDGDHIALGATLGYETTIGGWDFAPSLSASYREIDIDGYDEVDTFPDGGLALRFQEQSIESMRSILGFILSRPISRSFGVLTPSLRAEWHHEFEDDPRTVRAKYVVEDTVAGGSAPQDFGCAVSCFAMPTDAADSDYGVASLGLSALFPGRVQLYLVYEALLGAGSVSASSIAAGLRGQF